MAYNQEILGEDGTFGRSSYNDNMGVEEKDSALNFEYFVNYSIISDEYETNDFELMDISTGTGTQS